MEQFEVCDREVPAAFAFLTEEFGCAAPEIIGTRAARIGCLYRLYVNATTSVHVGWHDEFNSFDVILGRLIDGLPPSPGWDAEDMVELGAVLALRNPARAREWSDRHDLAPHVRLAAKLLREEAADVLRGDFSVFETILGPRQRHRPVTKKIWWDPKDPTFSVLYTREEALECRRKFPRLKDAPLALLAPCALCGVDVYGVFAGPEQESDLRALIASGGLKMVCRACAEAHPKETKKRTPW
jgi:hypothetical protein